MANRTLPPQAYTREVLAEAYDWLRSQSPSTKELARDVNTLVSFYLQAKRHNKIKYMNSGNAVEFKQDLKNLAEGIKKFDGEKQPPPQTMGENLFQHSANLKAQEEMLKTEPKPSFQPPSAPAGPTTEKPRRIYKNPYANLTTNEATQNSPMPAPKKSPLVAPATTVKKVDKKRQDILKKTQKLLNLSSEEEACNVLMSIGYERLKTLFKVEK